MISTQVGVTTLRMMTKARHGMGLEDPHTQVLLRVILSEKYDTLTIDFIYDILGGDNILNKQYSPISDAPDCVTGPLYTLTSLSHGEKVEGVGKRINHTTFWVVVNKDDLKPKYIAEEEQ